jgi:hypothetical protein
MKYQITCPKCKHEFAYDYGAVEAEYRRNSSEVQELHAKIAEFKLMPPARQKEFAHNKKLWVRNLARLAKRQAELKAAKKLAHDATADYELRNFKSLVKDEIGEARYVELWDMARKDAESYKIADMAKAPYSNGSKPVTSINKL